MYLHLFPVYAQAWRCAKAAGELQQLKADLPRKRARAAWLRLSAAARQAALQQRLQEARREQAVLAIQAAFRGWKVRRVRSRQLAGVRRFQVGPCA